MSIGRGSAQVLLEPGRWWCGRGPSPSAPGRSVRSGLHSMSISQMRWPFRRRSALASGCWLGSPRRSRSGSFRLTWSVGSPTPTTACTRSLLAVNRAPTVMAQFATVVDAARPTLERRWIGCCTRVFVDLDRFKAINDQHGHVVGDELLRGVAGRLRAALRRDDLIGRVGGDDFLIVCPNIGGSGEATHLAERLACALYREPPIIADIERRVSIGVAWSTGQEPSAEALVARQHPHGNQAQNLNRGAGEPRGGAPAGGL